MVSGDGEGVVDAADVGLLDNAGIVRYSASNTTPDAVRAATANGAVLVVTDQNRLRAKRWSEVRDNLGFTEQAGGADAPLTKDPGDARLPVFPGQQPSALTTTDDIGIKQVRASSYGNEITLTPRTDRRWRSTATATRRGPPPPSVRPSASASRSRSMRRSPRTT
jgi:hypothetical protein